MDKDTKEATLLIGNFSSKCSACGVGADPREEYHFNAFMQGKGCGAKYTKVASNGSYYNEEKDAIRESIQTMRPDLPYVERI